MKRYFRKDVSLVLSLALAMCAPISSVADEAGQVGLGGIGQMSKVKKKDVYQVLLPTDVNGVFDFMIDPEKLIEETDAAAYGGKSFEKGATVFFHRTDGQSAEEYSSSSDHVAIVNRSTVPVEVMVNVSVSPNSLGGITMTSDQTFANDSGASLYMALTDGVNTVPVGMGDSWIRTIIPAAPEEAFEYTYDQEHGEYNRRLKQELSGIQFPEYSFQLVGAANERGDWTALGKVSPLVNITWKVTPGQSLNFGKEDERDVDLDSERSDILMQILETEPSDRESVEEDADEERESADKESVDGEDDQGKVPVDQEPADGGMDQGRESTKNEDTDSNRGPEQNDNVGQNRETMQDGNTAINQESAQKENEDSNKDSLQNEVTD